MTRRAKGVYNVIIIGAGTAGLVTAAGTAGLGGRVALIERDRMGGDCLNTGCVPSKALLASARRIAEIRRAPDWGLSKQDLRFSFEEVFARMRERRAKIAPNDSEERFEALGVDVIRGEARFVSPHEVAVGDLLLEGRNVVIATGSRPAIPPIEGLTEVPYFTNETIFDELESQPDRLCVLGGGPVGCELAQVFTRLGTKVTILQRARQMLEKEDADAAGLVRRTLEAEGVRIVTGVEARRVTRVASRAARVWIEEEGGKAGSVDCDAVLVAAGRVPNTDGLDLEKAGVEYGKAGVVVNAHLQTSRPEIYAAGDVVGSFYFTHVADAHARVVVRNILFPWKKAKFDDSVVPWCTYTQPEVARVGWNEDQARRAGIECDVWSQRLGDLDRAVVESEEEGFAKVLTRRRSDQILGATIVSERAGDLLHEFVLAMKARVGLKKIAETIHAYPTFAELARKLADAQQKSRLTPLWKKTFAAMYRMRRTIPR
jgi:pyruvate/2-oxoglutarate dehydrogenase complex dihydrolipoamide dehydrogenase (E3) component